MGKCDAGNLSDLNSRRGRAGSSRLLKRINEVFILEMEKLGSENFYCKKKKWPVSIIKSKRFECLYTGQPRIVWSHQQKAQAQVFNML